MTKRTRAPANGNPTVAWVGATPDARDLETMLLKVFQAATDALEAATVPESYWQKVVASRQAKAWDVR